MARSGDLGASRRRRNVFLLVTESFSSGRSVDAAQGASSQWHVLESAKHPGSTDLPVVSSDSDLLHSFSAAEGAWIVIGKESRPRPKPHRERRRGEGKRGVM